MASSYPTGLVYTNTLFKQGYQRRLHIIFHDLQSRGPFLSKVRGFTRTVYSFNLQQW